MNKIFVSLRTKILLYFTILLLGIVGLISMILPKVMRQYLVASRIEDVQQTKAFVNDVLTANDFLKDSDTQRDLAICANSSEVCIWVCVRDGQGVSVLSFGKTRNSVEDFGRFGAATLTKEESALILSVLNGEKEGDFANAFNSAFKGQTYSLGYRQKYLSTESLGLYLHESLKDCAVFIHISMDDIITSSRQILGLIFVIIAVLSVACWLMVFFMSQSIVEPVTKLRNAAEAITKGDFSHNVEKTGNDEIGALTDSFNKMTKELKEVDQMQSDFIANISHDFRSPLTSIKGYVEAMLDGTIPEERYPRYLGIVLDETNRLAKLANNVLDLTKMENGQYELNQTVFDVNESIITLALGFEQRVEEHQIRMDFQLLQDKLFVYADLSLIERVIYNLLDNALKFTPDGGTVTVETSIVNRKATVSVSDTGMGISKESLPYVFERFHKGDRSRGKDKKGTGLGLTIAKQIMLAHHEDIDVFSTEGEGTTFTFTLPLASKK